METTTIPSDTGHTSTGAIAQEAASFALQVEIDKELINQ